MHPVYREHAPSAALSDVVQCYWTSRSAAPLGAAQVNRVLPDGCMDVIFNLGDPPSAAASPEHALRSYVVGAMRAPLEVRVSGMVDMLGVRFRPGGAAAFVRPPAGEFTDRAADLGDFWRDARELEERLHATPPERRIALLDSVLLCRMGRRDPRVAHVSELIERSGGAVPVQGLHEAVGLTRRHLERLYFDHVGLTPKTACRVARVQAALERLRAGTAPSLSRLALECGWYDQPHMNRDFREIAGVPPAAFARHVAFLQDAQRRGG
jgi:AraC-like DNA-binding protein